MRSARVIGVDEAGRGALAGPLVAAAVLLPQSRTFPYYLMRDSKVLPDRKRRELFSIIENSCEVSYGMVSHCLIDRIGIQAANVLAVDLALRVFDDSYLVRCDFIARFQKLTCSAKNVVLFTQGERFPEIAAASVMAKVMRDNLMQKLSEQYPLYSFDQHKGYGTRLHCRLVRKHGASPMHRLSFTIH